MDNLTHENKITTKKENFNIKKSHFIAKIIMEYLKVYENRENRRLEK